MTVTMMLQLLLLLTVLHFSWWCVQSNYNEAKVRATDQKVRC